MSIQPLQHEDVKRSLRQTSPNPADPQAAAAAPGIEDQRLRSQDAQQVQQTTTAEGEFSGRGSLINEII